MRGCCFRCCLMASRLYGDHRLQACCRSRSGKELARVGDRFDISRMALVAGSTRDSRAYRQNPHPPCRRATPDGKTDRSHVGPVQHRCDHSAGLSDEAMPPFWRCRARRRHSTRRASRERSRQFGPTIRKRCGRAASSIACCSRRPSSLPSSAKPAVITTAPLVPRAPSSAINWGTICGGVQITARSGDNGKLFTSA